MANDEWKSKAYQYQLNVFRTLTTPYQNIASADVNTLKVAVAGINYFHLKMNKAPPTSPENISSVILSQPVGEKVQLSFVVIVMNIELDGSLSKVPVFAIKTDDRRIFIDMNCTLYYSWKKFLKNNNLPPGEFCYPVGGQYNIGEELQIDYDFKPPAVTIHILKQGLGFVVALGLVVGSFFFRIQPVDHTQANTIMGIAHDFASRIRGSVGYIFQGFNIIQSLRSGCTCVVNVLTGLWDILKWLCDKFKKNTLLIFGKVKTALSNLYDWVGQKLHYFFEAASELAQDMFVAVTLKVDTDVNRSELEVEQMLAASVVINQQTTTVVKQAATLVTQVNTEKDSEYTQTIFKNAKTESAMQKGVETKGNQNLHHVTSDLLSISNSLAQILGKENLNDAQNIFETLSMIVIEEYKKKIEKYKKALAAARVSAGHEIDLDVFNNTMGIKGNPKDHYWEEAMMAAMETRIAYSIKEEVQKLEKQKKILLLELWKTAENDISGLYICVGVNGAGKFVVNDLIKALKDIKVELNEEKLVINETSSMIIIRTEDLTIAAMQELNSENTSESMVLIKRMEV